MERTDDDVGARWTTEKRQHQMETMAFFTKQNERPGARRNEDSGNNESSRQRPYPGTDHYSFKPHSSPRLAGFAEAEDTL